MRSNVVYNDAIFMAETPSYIITAGSSLKPYMKPGIYAYRDVRSSDNYYNDNKTIDDGRVVVPYLVGNTAKLENGTLVNIDYLRVGRQSRFRLYLYLTIATQICSFEVMIGQVEEAPGLDFINSLPFHILIGFLGTSRDFRIGGPILRQLNQRRHFGGLLVGSIKGWIIRPGPILINILVIPGI